MFHFPSYCHLEMFGVPIRWEWKDSRPKAITNIVHKCEMVSTEKHYVAMWSCGHNITSIFPWTDNQPPILLPVTMCE